MSYRETVSELVESLADRCGVYNQRTRFAGMTVQESRRVRDAGDESGYEGHADDCGCRPCWTGRLEARIWAAVRHETIAPAWKQAALTRQASIERHIKTVRALLSATTDHELTPALGWLIAEAESLMRLLEADVALGLDLGEVPRHGTQ